jgi:hypothetical protein
LIELEKLSFGGAATFGGVLGLHTDGHHHATHAFATLVGSLMVVGWFFVVKDDRARFLHLLGEWVRSGA